MEPERTTKLGTPRDLETRQKTTLGTPLSPKWDEEWVAEVENVEHQLNRRICGAHSPAFTPCKLGSTHKNGRCRYHGGLPGIGAPLGNRNAIIHGLYSRRLQQCGDHCALWQTCPMPNKDLEALPHKERPPCIYEKEEYDAVTFSLGREKVTKEKSLASDDATTTTHADAPDTSPDTSFPSCTWERNADANPDPPGVTLLHHNIATFQVMLSRAQAALGWHTYTEETHAEGDNYTMHSSKVSALLQAHQSIARELRQWVRLLGTDPVRLALNLPKADPYWWY